ncbi:hypothetical protein QA649_18545 [Bradyrhizobium sp. CB1717]|uniref:DUF6881 domain-containing protein n=1 Tax=Bradyrhizobium sp. CB1717 TaxID=3039154 RepID=UPI0024B07D69|nr:hypothetical protein [Bradyrhizobium sp. CB1717]WFU28141.1 hypothetical protein QA649_18545 [Bradyrhizobium sp. CB1717]
MSYISVQWLHELPDEPVWLLSELDEQRWEIRKIEIFRDGTKGYATQDEEAGGTRPGERPVPSLDEIATDPQFIAREITKEEFEQAWDARSSLQ